MDVIPRPGANSERPTSKAGGLVWPQSMYTQNTHLLERRGGGLSGSRSTEEPLLLQPPGQARAV